MKGVQSMTLEKKCLLAPYCSQAGNSEYCHQLCYPFTRLHGETGNGGLIAVANIPPKYRTSTLQNLPFKNDNPQAYAIVTTYGKKIIEKVDEGVGLYLFGVPSKENPKGVGNGKTTAATALIIEYLRQRVILEAKKERPVTDVPAFFMKMAKFQNVYNAQFRGSIDTKEINGDRYYALKQRMVTCDLLVLDDIGLRGITEALQNEIYEIIDERETNCRSTIFTSNVPLDQLNDILGEQIASRIEGMTIPVPFYGKDHRKITL